jgi:YEATS domain-containing protein 1/3
LLQETEYVEVQLELGHRADPFPRNAPAGFTHQWTLFVRGPDNCKIEEFVEKVIFHLHESFPKCNRSE